MDTLLENMDHARGPGGMPEAITGDRELAQRLLIRLSVPKGSFLPDAGLGSELYKLAGDPPQDRERLALHRASEALRPEGALVKKARLKEKGCALILTLDVELRGRRYPLEVKIC
jgi:hypothetical protein